MNMLEARVERANGGLAAVLGESAPGAGRGDARAAAGASRHTTAETVVLGIRPGGPRRRGARERRRDARGSGAASRCARRSARRCSSTSRSPRAQAVTDDMRELAEDVGDDRIVGQLAAGRAADEATLVGRFSPRTRAVEGDVRRGRRRRSGHCISSTLTAGSRFAAPDDPQRARAQARRRRAGDVALVLRMVAETSCGVHRSRRSFVPLREREHEERDAAAEKSAATTSVSQLYLLSRLDVATPTRVAAVYLLI